MKNMPPWLPYVAPFAAFLIMTTLEAQFPGHYPLVYAIKLAVVVAVLFIVRPKLPAGPRPNGDGIVAATALGVLLTFVWVLVDRHTPHFKWQGTRIGFDPYESIVDHTARTAFIGLRFIGLVVLVPFIEEMFYRGFLLRIVTDPDHFERVPIGKITAAALAVNILLFSLSHLEWLSAAIFALAMCGLIARYKNLFVVIWAHGVTNLLLGIYIMYYQDWQYW